ncbi:AGC kinase [Cardiosporidium cionae]|uniref:AGC kinase n=1 Tax=Cardiosporidium cionae TaxID=476202 RepID=A0ABQ7JGU4_9APIC|nr:AGC kinase [Cardiosporidium cionae]|eukprot:KAF8822925.1 AGC kinase [Cardiosporidium cionae]
MLQKSCLRSGGFRDSQENGQQWTQTQNSPLANSEYCAIYSMASSQRQLFTSKEYGQDLFKFEKVLGVGTLGCVRLATFMKETLPRDDVQRNLPQVVAIKVMEKSVILRYKQVDHINNELKILLSISHPFAIQCFGSFQDEKNLYLILEAVQGGEFFFYLREQGQLENVQAKFYAAQVCEIFDYLHSLHIIYRDLKPENLLVGKDGYLKLADFGFAKVVTLRTYTLCGTPEYIAPEMLLNKGHSKPLDWWTLGILIYEMLVGRPPFFDDEPIGIYKKIIDGKITFPAHIDKDAKRLIRKLLEADLGKRWGNLINGVNDIKKCKWMSEINFEDLQKKRITAMYIPSLQCDNDFSNFGAFSEDVNPVKSAAVFKNEGAPNPFPDW